MSTSISKLTTNLNVHQTLDNQPSLSATELKQAWDKPVNDIKDYINELLIPEVEGIIDVLTAISINYDDTNTELNATNVQNAIEKLKNLIDSLSFTASNISFSNTGTGLNATNVQSAIQEVVTKVGNASNIANSKIKYSDFAFSSSTFTVTLSASASKSGTVNLSKSGYYPLGIVGDTSTNEAIDIRREQLTTKNNGSGVISYLIQNEDYGNARTGYITFDVLWVKVS